MNQKIIIHGLALISGWTLISEGLKFNFLKMLKKNDCIRVDITDYTFEGYGIGKIYDESRDAFFPLFIKDTAIGDTADVIILKINKGYGYAKLKKIIKPSGQRIDPVCSKSSSCGGCQLRHINYTAQLEWKKKNIKNVMLRLGNVKAEEDYILCDVKGMDSPERYRNKAQYPVGSIIDDFGNKKIVTGFYAGRTHNIIPIDDCLIEPEIMSDILTCIKAFAKRNNISVYDENNHTGMLRHILIRTGFYTGEVMVVPVVNADINSRKIYDMFMPLASELMKVKSMTGLILNENTKKTNVILGNKQRLIAGREYIIDKIGDNIYRISAASFFQVNPIQTQYLYDKVLEYCNLKGGEIVWDLYCGTGTISLFLARMAGHVYGVEIVKDAISDAIINAKQNNINNASFICESAECAATNLPQPDVIVVDPPRKGCDKELLNIISNSKAKRLVYVSCNPSTMARDTELLSKADFNLKMLQPVDMFPHTTGCECVGLFERK